MLKPLDVFSPKFNKFLQKQKTIIVFGARTTKKHLPKCIAKMIEKTTQQKTSIFLAQNQKKNNKNTKLQKYKTNSTENFERNGQFQTDTISTKKTLFKKSKTARCFQFKMRTKFILIKIKFQNRSQTTKNHLEKLLCAKNDFSHASKTLCFKY